MDIRQGASGVSRDVPVVGHKMASGIFYYEKKFTKIKKKIFTLQNFFYHKKNNFWGGSSKTSPPEQNCCSIFKTVKSFPNGQRSRNLTWNYYCTKPNWIFPLFFTFISQRINFFAKPKTQSYSFSP